MELPSKFNNHNKSLQQGISLLGNGDLISNSKLIALVVDSNRIWQIFEKANLESQDGETQVMGSGRDVVDLLASSANFNIIIMAMVLPINNGVEVSLSFLYSIGIHGKILGVTACSYERERQAFLDAVWMSLLGNCLQKLASVLREVQNA
ncbi:hypothetical protein PVL29_025519 [Vitis rotundifolia]|uniref:Response regulatory domain-containing protein n=1 Tax=Vitis rotundifolia TaxID=103349 RepID=A0AA38YJZ8_VITRO|nr:hypothetical protein PVL29_025519 [Vitis rotundifolia]